jgi:hypothetical protein
MAKEKLHIDATLEGFTLYGIVSDAKEYRLAWQINKFLEINLILQEDIVLEFKSPKTLTCLYYLYEEEYWLVKLIKNLAVENVDIKSPFLLPELKNFDYLLMFDGEDLDEEDISARVGTLKQASFVQYINKIDLDKLKSVDNLMF